MTLSTLSKLKPVLLALPLVLAVTGAQAGNIIPITTTSTDNDPSLFLGLSWTFGASPEATSTAGVTLKVLSTNKRNAGALAAGVTYNFDGSFGCDLGVAHNGDDATLSFGYDICKRGFQMGLGATSKPDVTTTTVDSGD